jgi:hypothetical protein
LNTRRPPERNTTVIISCACDKHHAHERGTAGSLGAGALEFVVKSGVFELIQVECGGMANNTHRRVVVHQIAQKAVCQGYGATQQAVEYRQGKFCSHPKPHRMRCRADTGRAGRMVDGLHHQVDNLLAHIQHKERYAGLGEAQRHIPDGERRRHRPDHVKKPRYIAQGRKIPGK